MKQPGEFYESKPDEALRFGDIVRGFVLSAARIDSPDIQAPEKYHVELHTPDFAVVLSPCCSIGNQTLALSPLIDVRQAFFNNPYFVEDLTNINRPMPAEKAVSPTTWEQLSSAEKNKRLASGDGYAFASCFVYAPHDLLPEYTVHRIGNENIEIGHYMLDFARIHRVECDEIQREEKAPLKTKLLQLSIQARSELRTKLVEYYGRVPKEDEL